jgi:hypothetical protein
MEPIIITKDKNVLTVQINQSVSKDMISTLKEKIDGFINEHGHAPNLVISCKTAPHWASLRAFADHLDMVHDHHKLIKKIALVSDSAVFSILPKLVDYFVGAKLRHFKEDDYTKAVEWANAPQDAAGVFNLLKGFPSDLIGMEAVGLICWQLRQSGYPVRVPFCLQTDRRILKQ